MYFKAFAGLFLFMFDETKYRKHKVISEYDAGLPRLLVGDLRHSFMSLRCFFENE